jgi:hypothetical protein
MLDPLFVRPGETVRVSGVIDNAGAGKHATAEGVRALIAIPPGSGKRLTILAAISSPGILPILITDSVTLWSTDPIYIRYEPGTAYATRNTEGVYELPNSLVTEYDPKELDRRLFAGQGPLVGCRKADGVMPPGRTCALRFQAVFKVGYAAIDEDTDGLTTGLESAAAEPTVRVRDLEELYFSNAPEPGTKMERERPKPGSRLPVDCQLRGRDGTTWYHVASIEEDSNEGFVFVIAGCLGAAIGELAASAFDGTGKTSLHGAPLRPSSAANYRPVGQIEQGAFFRGGDGPVAAFTDPVSVLVERELRLGVRLINGGPDEIPSELATGAEDCHAHGPLSHL